MAGFERFQGHGGLSRRGTIVRGEATAPKSHRDGFLTQPIPHHAAAWFFPLLVCLASTAWSFEPQDLESIELCARSFVEAQSPIMSGDRSVTIGNLDPRLRLQRCDLPLEAFFPPGAQRGANTTVGVRCRGEKPWTLYVSARVTYTAPVIVAARPLPRGALLQSSDLVMVEREVASGPLGYLTDADTAVGMRLKRPVSVGSVLTDSLLEAAPTIMRGQRVTLVSQSAHLSVRMAGEALADAAPGERIKIRNLSSERIVEGTVTEDGLVRVSPAR